MKNKFSKIGVFAVGISLFVLSILVPSQKAKANINLTSECTWQEIEGGGLEFDYFCGFEAHTLHCTCGDFC